MSIRNKILEIDEHEDAASCGKIRREIMSLFESPTLMWQDTARGRKAYRLVGKAIEIKTCSTSKLQRRRVVQQIDAVFGHEGW